MLAEEQVLRYEDEFVRPPEIVPSKGSEPLIRLAGRESSQAWRDWIVSRLLPDLKKQFPEVGESPGIHGQALQVYRSTFRNWAVLLGFQGSETGHPCPLPSIFREFTWSCHV
jgi:hypothetical protein